MNTGNIHFKDTNFQSQHAPKSDLLIRITPNSISYAVADHIQNQLKVISYNLIVDNVKTDLKKLIEKDFLSSYHFNKIKVSILTPSFTFIPDELFDEEQAGNYSKFIQPDVQSSVFITKIRSANISNIIASDTEVYNLLKQYFPRVQIFSQAEPLIESCMKKYSSAGLSLMLQFNSTSFEALLLKENKIQFYNLFTINSADDFNYFLLLLLTQFNLDLKQLRVTVSGDIQEDSEYYQRLSKYFDSIDKADSTKIIQFSDVFNEVPVHQFFSLVGLSLCE